MLPRIFKTLMGRLLLLLLLLFRLGIPFFIRIALILYLLSLAFLGRNFFFRPAFAVISIPFTHSLRPSLTFPLPTGSFLRRRQFCFVV